MKTYIPKDITKMLDQNGGDARFKFSYVREVDLGDDEIIKSDPHVNNTGLTNTPEGRAAEWQINPDGTTRTGQQILDEFGVS